jgi:hypothetical protein
MHSSDSQAGLPAEVASYVSVQDSVITGDVTIQQADPQAIADVVDQTGRCPNCGEANANVFSCSSSDCSIQFCFKCMQQYLHGHSILEHKYCRSHHEAELSCLPLDEQFASWEQSTRTAINSVESAKKFKKNAPMMRNIGVVLGIITAIATIGASDPSFIVVGLFILIISFLLPVMAPTMLNNAIKSLETKKQSMPNANPHGRPVVSGRVFPNFTDEVVRNNM